MSAALLEAAATEIEETASLCRNISAQAKQLGTAADRALNGAQHLASSVRAGNPIDTLTDLLGYHRALGILRHITDSIDSLVSGVEFEDPPEVLTLSMPELPAPAPAPAPEPALDPFERSPLPRDPRELLAGVVACVMVDIDAPGLLAILEVASRQGLVPGRDLHSLSRAMGYARRLAEGLGGGAEGVAAVIEGNLLHRAA